MMDAISAEDKDKVLKWFYEADVNGKELPQDCLPERSKEICAILIVDGYVISGRDRGKLTIKGQAFYLNGGYVKECEEKNRLIKIAEEANEIAKRANKKAGIANFIAILAIASTVCIGFINTRGTDTNSLNSLEVNVTPSYDSIPDDSVKSAIVIDKKADVLSDSIKGNDNNDLKRHERDSI